MSVTDLGPKLPPHLRKTYTVHHITRTAMCHEIVDGYVVCPAFWNGWVTDVNPTDQTKDAAAIVQYFDSGDSGRHFTKEWMPDGFWRYTFSRGQSCFARPHVIPDRQETPQYLLLAGDDRQYFGERDGRGNIIPMMRHSSADAFIDDFASHQERLAKAAE